MALTAVVTGASGYLAGEVIHQLLAKGYNVRGTVTNVEDRRKTGPLVALRKALPGKLTLTEADLFEPGSFDDVVKGADFVFHTASNVIFDSSNPEVSLLSCLHSTRQLGIHRWNRPHTHAALTRGLFYCFLLPYWSSHVASVKSAKLTWLLLLLLIGIWKLF